MSDNHLPQRELERLSAYLDGELNARQARKLEARLRADPGLQKILDELQALSNSLHVLPTVRPPRSFTLTPEMAGATEQPGAYPILRFATVLAAFAFVVLVGVDVLSGTIGGAMTARSMDQIAAEAPAAAELDMADAAKSEVEEPMADLESAPAELAGAEAPMEEQAAEGLAVAEPTVEVETAAEERSVGESEAEADAQLAPPEMTEPSEDELQLTYSATELPEAEAMLEQPEPAQLPSGEALPTVANRATPPIPLIRIAEAGLALITLMLGGVMLWARSRSR